MRASRRSSASSTIWSIVDVDAHHYENESYGEILPFMENDVLRQLSLSAGSKRNRSGIVPTQVGYQDMGGRVTRYPMRGSEKTDGRAARATSSSAIAGWTP